ncbi:MAG: PqqD family protein [Planctomycetes bacterium]|nr:PqqD family protein [Planctomycetota bacterium]
MPSSEPALTQEQQLALRPQRNARATVLLDEPERVRLAVPLSYRGPLALARRLLRLREQRTYVLDGLGLELWRRIDGTTTVAGLVEWLERDEGLSFQEARLLLADYLGTLTARGLVAVAVPAGQGG